MGEAKCKWCGKTFTKKSNRQVCCCKECQDHRTRELTRKRRNRHYRRYKTGNTPTASLTELGSLGTSSTCHKKDNFLEEFKSLNGEYRRLGLKKSYADINLKSLQQYIESSY